MKRSKLLIILITSLTVFCIVFLYYQQSRLLEGIEAKTYDFRFNTLRGPLAPSPDIVIIAIDDKSLAELGRFPWSRTYFSSFVDKITEIGVRGVFLDVFFPEKEDESADSAFARSLGESGLVSLAMAFEFAADGSVRNVTQSLPQLQAVSQYSSHINLTPDEDGVVRWMPLLLRDGENIIYALALNAARVLLDANEVTAGIYDITVGKKIIPTDGNHFALINYTGPPGIYPRISFVDVLKNRVDPSRLKDKLLLVGSTALGIYDMRVTPFSNNSPGVEVHANMIDSIRRGNFIQRGGFEALVDLIAIIALGIITAFITISLRHAISLPLVLLLLFGHVATAYALFLSGHWVSMVYPELSIILAYSMTAYLRFFFLDQKSRQIRNIFSSYVSEKVVDQLIENPNQAKVGGENRQLTILFSDVRNYTGFSEDLPADEVVRNINRYLAAMTDIIMSHDGTLDKFMGDGIMAFWSAPLVQENHAELAVDCAVSMLQKMDEIGLQMQNEGKEPLSIRIGINSGNAVVGNIGAENKKIEYTALGDTVNVASRLEQANKFYGTSLLIGELTRSLLPDKLVSREIDFVRMRGKKRPMIVHEVLFDNYDLASPFMEALMAYRQKNFTVAEKLFAELESSHEDTVSAIYLQRCREFIDNPPADDWDGVHYALQS